MAEPKTTPKSILDTFAARYQKLGDVRELMEVAGYTDDQIKKVLSASHRNGLKGIITRRGRKDLVDPDALFEVLQGLDVTPE